jgi:hypothetical protein
MTKSVLFGVALASGIVVAIPAAAAEAVARPSATQPPAMPEKFVGTWRIVSETLVDQNGATVGSAFPDPVGKVTYTPRGDLWAIAGSRASLEAGTALWYTATAEVHRKARVIVHHVQASSSPSLIGTDQVRGFQFSAHDKRLALTTEFASGLTDVLRWRKVGARWAGPL